MVVSIREAMPAVVTPDAARRLGQALRERWTDERIERLLQGIGRRAEVSASRAWQGLERRSPVRGDAAGYDAEDLVAAWSRRAAALITSVRDGAAEAMRRDVLQALERGDDPAKLAAGWRRRGIPVLRGTLEGRVKVIAQHQLTTLHAEVQRQRARSLGVVEFFWRTQGDEDVRDVHQSLADRVFAYADPPSEGLPGQPVNCRCWAESVIPDGLLGGFGVRGAV